MFKQICRYAKGSDFDLQETTEVQNVTPIVNGIIQFQHAKNKQLRKKQNTIHCRSCKATYAYELDETGRVKRMLP